MKDPGIQVLRCPGHANGDWSITHECMTCLHYLMRDDAAEWMTPPEQQPCPDRMEVGA